MLKMEENCENCAKPLPMMSGTAYICSYECSFCAGCAEDKFNRICPNCGGDLQKRPRREQKSLNS